MIRRGSLNYEGKPLWVGAAVVGVIGIAAADIAWRPVRRHAAANGVTVMPTWVHSAFRSSLVVRPLLRRLSARHDTFHVGGRFHMSDDDICRQAHCKETEDVTASPNGRWRGTPKKRLVYLL